MLVPPVAVVHSRGRCPRAQGDGDGDVTQLQAGVLQGVLNVDVAVTGPVFLGPAVDWGEIGIALVGRGGSRNSIGRGEGW